METIVIGIDIGGTNTEFGIVTEKGNIHNRRKIRTCDYPDIQDFVDELASQIKQMLKDFEASCSFIGIGIGAPNGNIFTGAIEFAPNLNWKGTVPLVDLLKAHFDTNIFLTNDANAAAIGEKIYGGAKNMSDFILITLGTGLGSGFYANGKLIYGHDGFAGELGHTIYDPTGRQCGCGKLGCLETYVSAPGIVRTLREALQTSDMTSSLRNINIDDISSKDIFLAAQNGDVIALEAFDYTAKILGMKLSDAVAITSPEAIFLFGGLANAGDLLLLPIKKYMEEYLLPVFRGKVKLLQSELPENSAAILGAAALVFENLKS
ncbi:MAG: glucokinase [Ignavibacteria bacterium]|nr:glucokinase [Ignavibacteria bacterium]